MLNSRIAVIYVLLGCKGIYKCPNLIQETNNSVQLF